MFFKFLNQAISKHNFIFKVVLFVINIVFLINNAKAENDLKKTNRYSQSLSIQFGINGYLSDKNSFGLQLIPPDLSYSVELFDNDIFNISTAIFYDNIGVKIKDSNFSYRFGQRLDFGYEFGIFTPYITMGLGSIRKNHNYQTSMIYGGGFLTKIRERILWANEINFQDVHRSNSSYKIANLSTGIVYAF